MIACDDPDIIIVSVSLMIQFQILHGFVMSASKNLLQSKLHLGVGHEL